MPAQNLRSLRQRIRSVQNTQKITKAMQMVAGAKLRRMQGELLSLRPYAQRLEGMVERFLAAYPGFQHPLLMQSASQAPAGLILITSDTGLCGTYNEKMVNVAEKFLLEFPSARVVAIGRKGNRTLIRKRIPRLREVLDWGGRYQPDKVGSFTGWLKELYRKGEVSAWHIAYTQFISALRWKPTVTQLLPLGQQEALPEFPEKLIVEPDPERFADELLERFLGVQLSRILLEAFTAEHSARMIAMKNATENATEMIDTLTLVRNKVRQAAITKELIEVVSGAQALQ